MKIHEGAAPIEMTCELDIASGVLRGEYSTITLELSHVGGACGAVEPRVTRARRRRHRTRAVDAELPLAAIASGALLSSPVRSPASQRQGAGDVPGPDAAPNALDERPTRGLGPGGGGGGGDGGMHSPIGGGGGGGGGGGSSSSSSGPVAHFTRLLAGSWSGASFDRRDRRTEWAGTDMVVEPCPPSAGVLQVSAWRYEFPYDARMAICIPV